MRYITFNVKFDPKSWSRWSETIGIDNRCQNFLLLYSSELMNHKHGHSKVNARNYTMFSNIISGIEDWNKPENLALILQIASGCFLEDNDVVGSLFTQFIANKLDHLITPDDLVLGDWDSVKRKLKKQLYDEDQYRADIASVITTRFINFSLKWLENKKDISVIISRILEIIECDTILLSEDLLFSLVKTITINYPRQSSKLVLNPKIASKLTK